MVEYLVKNGSDINAQTGQGDTLIHLAVNIDNTEWMETLLKRWGSIVDLTIKNNKGLTPYQYAEQLGFETIRRLLGASYPKVEKASEIDGNGLTGLMLAIMRKDQKAIERMAGDAQAINKVSQDRYRNSPLHLALIYQNVAAAKTLLAHGASCTLANAQGALPTHYLVRVWQSGQQLEIAKVILAKAPETIYAVDHSGNTLVHYIVQYNDGPLLGYLVGNYGMQVKKALDTKNKALESPKGMADKMNRRTMVTTLVAASR